MNIIKTVGDLRKALSAYDQDLPISIVVDGKVAVLNNDTQIYSLTSQSVQDVRIAVSYPTEK